MLPLHNLSSEQELMLISKTRYDGISTNRHQNYVNWSKVHINRILCPTFAHSILIVWNLLWNGAVSIQGSLRQPSHRRRKGICIGGALF